jgi:hypothetical protein
LVPDEPAYLNVTIPLIGATHWADIEGTQNPRSGFLFHQELFVRFQGFDSIEDPAFTLFRSLAVAKLDQRDVTKIIDFMFGEQSENNV